MFKKTVITIVSEETGMQLNDYARKYRNAAIACSELAFSEKNKDFDIVPPQLLCQSLELHLKSFIWYVDNKDSREIKKIWSRY